MDTAKETVRLALFGESNVGKSHYGGQLVARIETERYALRLRTASPDLGPFEEVRSQLNAGLPASHTPSAVYKESIWPIITTEGLQFDLVWPDYGGEQIKQLIDTRRMDEAWLDRVQSAHGWLLMVRPELAKQDDDIFSKPLGDVRPPALADIAVPRRSTQARLVELVQMLLHIRGLKKGSSPPALVVLLSCWDELGLVEGTKPTDVLSTRLPLLASFINNRWKSGLSTVYGLSALEIPLLKDQANEEFINRGPENFGFVIDSEGGRNPDLTLPIARVAVMAASA
jgi:hypothetical protein